MSDAEWAQVMADARPYLLQAARKRLRLSQADAEDAVQAALEKAWRRRQAFKGLSDVRTWLYAIMVNEWLGVLRRARFVPNDPQDNFVQPEAPVLVELAEALERLTEQETRLVVQIAVGGGRHAACAALARQMGLRTGTVRGLRHRLFTKIRRFNHVD